jgi:hypothetical protein
MSPDTDLVESVKEDSKKAQDYDMKSSNSSGQCHISYEHGHGAYYGFSHSHLSDIRAIEPPEVSFEADYVVGPSSQRIVIIIVSQSDSDPEAFNDKVVLDGKN